MRDRRRPSRPQLLLLAAVLPAMLVLGGCRANAAPTWSFPAPSGGAIAGAGSQAPIGSTPPAAGSPGATASTDGAAAGSIDVEAYDLGFKPSQIEVPKAGTYAVSFKNTGSITHDLTFADGTKLTAEPGKTVTGQVAVPKDGIAFLCSIPGHAQAGMQGNVLIAGYGSGTGGGSTGGDSTNHGGLPADLPPADPNAPAPVRYDPTAPKVLDGTTHDITLTIQERLMTVATGYVMSVWTFNGTVPGPVIRVHEGDTVRVHLVNPASNKLPHSVDFHASQVAWNDEMTSINPGQEKLYEWRADYAGVWMYHCGTAPALHHIANGMFGMVIVEPPGGFGPADQEFALVQNDWYFGGQGQITDLKKASAGAPSPDWVTFNGVANQYKDGPIKVDTGKRIRLFVLDAGPNIDSSFHIVGTIFDRVVKEGVEMTSKAPGHWGSQAVDLSPAQGALIEFTTAEDGLYPIVTHAFNFPGRGALGLIQAGDGDPKN